ncbi:MAG: carbohydrate kinase [Candidatus Brocadiia bacterium]|nr:MAG: carbohydrate kinase [Candidatus Brocadiia bacterium]
MYLLGYDIGTSSIKASLIKAESGKVISSAMSPAKEMEIISERPGWAEQEPQLWWDHVKAATAQLLARADIDRSQIKAIGITYQMHGLVCVDKDLRVLRRSIIWCDSRAVEIGEKAAKDIGEQRCLENLLNYPGNFTAGKIKWVMENEPAVYQKIYKIMLPGDYIAMKMTGEVTTTQSGLSEGILWDFKNERRADFVLDYYGISPSLLPDIVPVFGVQGKLTKFAAQELGLKENAIVSYRSGDQPNNALSLNVLEPGEIAATAGTSGVVYGIGDKPAYDPQSRVNTFVHVNSQTGKPRHGVLLCVNGTGILNSWLKHNAAGGMDYDMINKLAAKAPVGCDGLVTLPYGNGAERTLGNRNIGASINGINFNTHTISHCLRSAQEGIVFALNYGLDIMRTMGVSISKVRAGDANMFLSPIFSSAFASVSNAVVELYNTDGAQGAARGAGIGAGIYKNQKEAFTGLEKTRTIEPDNAQAAVYERAYNKWLTVLNQKLN